MGKEIPIDLADLMERQDPAPRQKKEPVIEKSRTLPSPSRSRTEALKYDRRIVWAFNLIPETIKREFQKEARKRGITDKAFFLHCLRAGGLEIPPYEALDGRRR